MLKTCSNLECQKLFSGNVNSTLCRTCQQKEDSAFEVVKAYLAEHPGAAVMEIHQQTEIPLDVINALYESGRLAVVVLQKCSKCGNTIRENPGNLMICQDCAKTMQSQLSSELSSLQLRPQAPVQTTRASNRDSGKSYGLGGKR
jgi:protein-arginine kinase activator protein McsA